MPTYTIQGKRIRTNKPLSDADIDEIAASLNANVSSMPPASVAPPSEWDTEAPLPEGIPGPRAEQAPMAWSDVGKGFARNIIPSTGQLLKGTAEAILSPIDTATALGALAKSEFLLATGQGSQEELAAAQSFNNMYKQRYGSAEGFKQALATDPASVLADVSTVLTGGAGALGKMGAPAKVTGALSTAAAATNPLTLGPVGMLPPVRAAGGFVANKAAEYLVPEALGGGKTLLENRAFRAALGDDPALMQQAVARLNQGRTIQEVAVELNSPSLAAFAKNAETAFGARSTDVGAIQRQFEQQQAARQQGMANQLATAQQGLQGLQVPAQQQIAAAESGLAAQQRLAAAMDQYRAQQLAGAQTQANQLAAQVAQTPPAVNALRVQTPETVGEALRTSAKAAQTAAKEPIQARANAAIEAARGTEAYSRSLSGAAQSILDEPITALMPSTAPETRAILQRVTPQPIRGGLMGTKQVGSTLPTMSLDELDALRRAINSDLARTEQAVATGAAANAGMTQRNLLTLKNAVDELITTSPTLAPGAAQEYMGAMRQFGTEYAPAFRSETSRKLLGTKFGEPRLKAEDVVKTYFAPGSVAEPQQFLRMAQYDPSLLDTMRTGIESVYRREVLDKTGVINPAKHADFMRRYQDPLRVLSQGGVDVSGIQAAGQAATQAEQAAGKIAGTTQQIEKLGKQLPEPTGQIPVGRGGLPEVQQRVSQVEAEMQRAAPAREQFAAQEKARLAGAEATLKSTQPIQKRLEALQDKIGKEGTAALNTPKSVAEIESIANAVSQQLDIGEAFKGLAVKGQRLGVKSLEAPESLKIPTDIKTEIVINGVKKIMGASMNEALAKRIALKILSNKETAVAIDRAYQAQRIGKTVSTELSRAVKVAPGITNVLSGARNENALSR